MSPSQRELGRLLAGEIARRSRALGEPSTPDIEVRAALHSLKGSAAMAGYTELALLMAQFDQRMQAGVPGVRAEARLALDYALARLNRDLPPFANVWPEPPPFLGASLIDSKYRAHYYGAIRERLLELDGVLGDADNALEGVERAQRAVHAMKGAAAAMSDDVTAWYCHGLEAALSKVPREASAAAAALLDLARHRALFNLLLDDPARALETLRALAQRRSLTPAPEPSPAKGARKRSPSGEFEANSALFLMVPVQTLDAFSERLERIDLIYDELLRTSERARKLAARLHETSAGLNEAKRQLETPSEPWPSARARIETASAVLRTSAGNSNRGADLFRRSAESLRARTAEMRSELTALRRTSLHGVFERVKHATLRNADDEGKRVAVDIVGRDVLVDQRLSQRLHDTVLQLARNSLIHGLEAPDARALAGKAEAGRITLSAEQIGEWLRVTVADDGRGADVERIRQIAVAAGTLSAEAAQRAHADDLLALLFLPGLTTHRRADLLAGRGLGLDLVQDTVRRLGGTIRLRGRPEGGLVASFEMPSDHTVVDVLWLEELGQRFALPVGFTGRVERSESDAGKASPVRLAHCLDRAGPARAPVALELTVYGIAPIRVGLDAVGQIEQVHLRPLPDLLAERGPYSGAVLRGDGSLHLALDAPLVAARAWTLRPVDAA